MLIILKIPFPVHGFCVWNLCIPKLFCCTILHNFPPRVLFMKIVWETRTILESDVHLNAQWDSKGRGIVSWKYIMKEADLDLIKSPWGNDAQSELWGRIGHKGNSRNECPRQRKVRTKVRVSEWDWGGGVNNPRGIITHQMCDGFRLSRMPRILYCRRWRPRKSADSERVGCADQLEAGLKLF